MKYHTCPDCGVQVTCEISLDNLGWRQHVAGKKHQAALVEKKALTKAVRGEGNEEKKETGKKQLSMDRHDRPRLHNRSPARLEHGWESSPRGCESNRGDGFREPTSAGARRFSREPEQGRERSHGRSRSPFQHRNWDGGRGGGPERTHSDRREYHHGAREKEERGSEPWHRSWSPSDQRWPSDERRHSIEGRPALPGVIKGGPGDRGWGEPRSLPSLGQRSNVNGPAPGDPSRANQGQQSGNGSREEPTFGTGLGICRFFNTEGGCKHGNHCRYKHIEARLLTPEERKSVQVCKFYLTQEGCSNGARCSYRHVQSSSSFDRMGRPLNGIAPQMSARNEASSRPVAEPALRRVSPAKGVPRGWKSRPVQGVATQSLSAKGSSGLLVKPPAAKATSSLASLCEASSASVGRRERVGAHGESRPPEQPVKTGPGPEKRAENQLEVPWSEGDAKVAAQEGATKKSGNTVKETGRGAGVVRESASRLGSLAEKASSKGSGLGLGGGVQKVLQTEKTAERKAAKTQEQPEVAVGDRDGLGLTAEGAKQEVKPTEVGRGMEEKAGQQDGGMLEDLTSSGSDGMGEEEVGLNDDDFFKESWAGGEQLERTGADAEALVAMNTGGTEEDVGRRGVKRKCIGDGIEGRTGADESARESVQQVAGTLVERPATKRRFELLAPAKVGSLWASVDQMFAGVPEEGSANVVTSEWPVDGPRLSRSWLTVRDGREAACLRPLVVDWAQPGFDGIGFDGGEDSSGEAGIATFLVAEPEESGKGVRQEELPEREVTLTTGRPRVRDQSVDGLGFNLSLDGDLEVGLDLRLPGAEDVQDGTRDWWAVGSGDEQQQTKKPETLTLRHLKDLQGAPSMPAGKGNICMSGDERLPQGAGRDAAVDQDGAQCGVGGFAAMLGLGTPVEREQAQGERDHAQGLGCPAEVMGAGFEGPRGESSAKRGHQEPASVRLFGSSIGTNVRDAAGRGGGESDRVAHPQTATDAELVGRETNADAEGQKGSQSRLMLFGKLMETASTGDGYNVRVASADTRPQLWLFGRAIAPGGAAEGSGTKVERAEASPQAETVSVAGAGTDQEREATTAEASGSPSKGRVSSVPALGQAQPTTGKEKSGLSVAETSGKALLPAGLESQKVEKGGVAGVSVGGRPVERRRNKASRWDVSAAAGSVGLEKWGAASADENASRVPLAKGAGVSEKERSQVSDVEGGRDKGVLGPRPIPKLNPIPVPRARQQVSKSSEAPGTENVPVPAGHDCTAPGPVRPAQAAPAPTPAPAPFFPPGFGPPVGSPLPPATPECWSPQLPSGTPTPAARPVAPSIGAAPLSGTALRQPPLSAEPSRHSPPAPDTPIHSDEDEFELPVEPMSPGLPPIPRSPLVEFVNRPAPTSTAVRAFPVDTAAPAVLLTHAASSPNPTLPPGTSLAEICQTEGEPKSLAHEQALPSKPGGGCEDLPEPEADSETLGQPDAGLVQSHNPVTEPEESCSQEREAETQGVREATQEVVKQGETVLVPPTEEAVAHLPEVAKPQSEKPSGGEEKHDAAGLETPIPGHGNLEGGQISTGKESSFKVPSRLKLSLKTATRSVLHLEAVPSPAATDGTLTPASSSGGLFSPTQPTQSKGPRLAPPFWPRQSKKKVSFNVLFEAEDRKAREAKQKHFQTMADSLAQQKRLKAGGSEDGSLDERDVRCAAVEGGAEAPKESVLFPEGDFFLPPPKRQAALRAEQQFKAPAQPRKAPTLSPEPSRDAPSLLERRKAGRPKKVQPEAVDFENVVSTCSGMPDSPLATQCAICRRKLSRGWRKMVQRLCVPCGELFLKSGARPKAWAAHLRKHKYREGKGSWVKKVAGFEWVPGDPGVVRQKSAETSKGLRGEGSKAPGLEAAQAEPLVSKTSEFETPVAAAEAPLEELPIEEPEDAAQLESAAPDLAAPLSDEPIPQEKPACNALPSDEPIGEAPYLKASDPLAEYAEVKALDDVWAEDSVLHDVLREMGAAGSQDWKFENGELGGNQPAASVGAKEELLELSVKSDADVLPAISIRKEPSPEYEPPNPPLVNAMPGAEDESEAKEEEGLHEKTERGVSNGDLQEETPLVAFDANWVEQPQTVLEEEVGHLEERPRDPTPEPTPAAPTAILEPLPSSSRRESQARRSSRGLEDGSAGIGLLADSMKPLDAVRVDDSGAEGSGRPEVGPPTVLKRRGSKKMRATRGQMCAAAYESEKGGRFTCVLCRLGSSLDCGPLYHVACGLLTHLCTCAPFSDAQQYIHRMCARWTGNVQDLEYEEMGGLPEAVENGLRKRCSLCETPGATLECRAWGCPRTYHYQCAFEAECQVGQTDEYGLLSINDVGCPDHFIFVDPLTPLPSHLLARQGLPQAVTSSPKKQALSIPSPPTSPPLRIVTSPLSPTKSGGSPHHQRSSLQQPAFLALPSPTTTSSPWGGRKSRPKEKGTSKPDPENGSAKGPQDPTLAHDTLLPPSVNSLPDHWLADLAKQSRSDPDAPVSPDPLLVQPPRGESPEEVLAARTGDRQQSTLKSARPVARGLQWPSIPHSLKERQALEADCTKRDFNGGGKVDASVYDEELEGLQKVPELPPAVVKSTGEGRSRAERVGWEIAGLWYCDADVEASVTRLRPLAATWKAWREKKGGRGGQWATKEVNLLKEYLPYVAHGEVVLALSFVLGKKLDTVHKKMRALWEENVNDSVQAPERPRVTCHLRPAKDPLPGIVNSLSEHSRGHIPPEWTTWEGGSPSPLKLGLITPLKEMLQQVKKARKRHQALLLKKIETRTNEEWASEWVVRKQAAKTGVGKGVAFKTARKTVAVAGSGKGPTVKSQRGGVSRAEEQLENYLQGGVKRKRFGGGITNGGRVKKKERAAAGAGSGERGLRDASAAVSMEKQDGKEPERDGGHEENGNGRVDGSLLRATSTQRPSLEGSIDGKGLFEGAAMRERGDFGAGKTCDEPCLGDRSEALRTEDEVRKDKERKAGSETTDGAAEAHSPRAKKLKVRLEANNEPPPDGDWTAVKDRASHAVASASVHMSPGKPRRAKEPQVTAVAPEKALLEIAGGSEDRRPKMKSQPAKVFERVGDKLLMEDLPAETADNLGVTEKAPIPVTNDVDDNRDIFKFKYIKAISARQMSDQVQRIKRRSDAPSCTDCGARHWDDPWQPLSVHILHCFEQRPSAGGSNKKKGERVEIPLAMKGRNPVWQRAADSRTDWQGEPMMGRLPYDRFGRLLLRAVQDLPDMNANIRILECNTRCACIQQGTCRNAFTRRGLDAQVEVFRTNNGKGWGVLTRQRILRGHFLSEYIGELLLSKEADMRGGKYDGAGCSYLFNRGREKKMVVVDANEFSNVTRFINHSCSPNLAAMEIYGDSLDPRFSSLDIFALRDIEAGSELTLNYGYADRIQQRTDENVKEIPCRCTPYCTRLLWR